MSILRQLLLSITLAITVILLGTLALNLTAARDYLAGQLQAQSTDAAVSLALSLSQPGNSEPVTQELLIAAMFDGGHFARIALTAPEQQPGEPPLIVREVEGAPQYDAPDWFRAMMPIGTKSATRSVTNGWQQLGDITVVANDVYAWETLWASSLRMIMLVFVAGLAWTVFAFALVHWIQRRLLAEISTQVQAIGQGRLEGATITASVPEFSGVAEALNQAREQLRITAEEQEAKVEALEIELNRDETTGVANRRYFLNEFRRALGEVNQTADGALPGGHVLILHLRDLAAINRHMRRRATDQWLTAICQRLGEMLGVDVGADSQPGQPLLARLNGADFAILLPVSEQAMAIELAARVRAELLSMRVAISANAQCRWAIALTNYYSGSDISSVLTRLNQGLIRAENADSDEVALMSCDP